MGFSRRPPSSSLPCPARVEREIYGRHAAETAGVSPEAVAQEVKKAFQRRLRKEQKQQERRDLTRPSSSSPSPGACGMKTSAPPGRREGVLRLLLLDPSLHRELTQLRPEEFSSPAGQGIRPAARRAEGMACPPSCPCWQGELTGEEMDHLTQVASSPESMVNSRQSLADYIAVIRAEAIKGAAQRE